MKQIFVFSLLFTSLFLPRLSAQSNQKIVLDGYVFEENNRGFIREAMVRIMDYSGVIIAADTTNEDGRFTVEVPWGRDYIVETNKKIFIPKRDTLSSSAIKAGEKMFVKVEIQRQPGYLFEVTLTEKKYANEPADAVKGARIEIYNNTKKEVCLRVDSALNPVFGYTFEQGNHYTIFLRKKGYFNKRMEAHVNIDGCILCFEGVGTVTPGIVDNISTARDNKLGMLLANVELDRIDTNRIVSLNNIYYDYNSANLRQESQSELNKLATLFKMNPHLKVELSSHTDSRGSEEYNKVLSQARAESAVDYLIGQARLKRDNLKAKGYGESQLINGCADGVNCSEKEHERNRRTELRITGVGPDPLESLSLAEIIHEEEMEKFINSGNTFSSVYVAPPADTTAAAVKKVEEKVEAVKEVVKTTFQKVEASEAANTKVVKSELKVVDYPTPAASKTEKADKKSNKKEKKVEPKVAPKPVQTIKEEVKSEKVEQKTKVQIKQPESTEVVKKIDMGSSAPAPEMKKIIQTEEIKMMDGKEEIIRKTEVNGKAVPKMDKIEAGTVIQEVEKEVRIEKTVAAEKKVMFSITVSGILPDYVGYKVELFTTASELKLDSPMLRGVAENVSSNISLEKMPNGYAYLVGEFQTWSETESFLEKVKKDYPKAKIVDYLKGKRVQ
ncbi:MAG: hypothetical protein RL757_1304 [Bacteroidota bacterium]|jgi:outer membrane protein OmpA-like peptidoglycan-associated protein